MIERIKELEELSRLLDPDEKRRNDWNSRVLAYANSFLNNLGEAKVYQTSNGIDRESIYDYDISEQGVDLDLLLGGIKKNIDTPGINAASGGHLGYIPGGGIYPAALGDYLAAVTNRYAGIFYAAPGAVKLENMLIRWMCRLMGFPSDAAGNLTSGGSIANLTAVITAREAASLKARDFHRAVIYLSKEAHHSLQKALKIAGLAEAQIRYIPLDEDLKLSVDALKTAIEEDKSNNLIPFFINASLGTTNTGTVDPIGPIGRIAADYKIWFHVDAAYGGFFKLVDECSPAFNGVEKADSITLDPHKGLFLPFGTGAVLIKDHKAVHNAHHYMADYLQDAEGGNENVISEEVSPADVSPELTKHFRGLRVWLPLKLFGLKAFRAALEEKIYLARYFQEQVQQVPGFEIGPGPDLSIGIFRYVPKNQDANKFNQWLLEEILEDGRIFLSSTTIDGVFWIRVAVLSFRAHLKQIDLALKIIKEKAEGL
ncbi:pyridoxal phosphate-dependent decarboxylase family protein [Xanthovirga aplysinae]|uniref:pyridoxal phosphate-dependent decarboxylase family protein n=1 Tax=Xanthovirga aplysinae TaxID=2529853 RepID=UPI0012BBBB67|nr:aminotransferase class V-fold PLP-dependent enzyme [Xanthovirga aplysinae]